MRIFKEQQRFTQLWLIILIVISAFTSLGLILASYIKNPSSFSTGELASTISITLLASGLIFIFKLTTRIDEHGIYYKFFPFHLKFKTIKWPEIDKVYVRTYNALHEYGGWGIKGGSFWNKSKGTALNVSGDIGIQLELKNGKKLLIGTQKESQATTILGTYKLKINTYEKD